jgi:hypothetical protein
MFQRHLLNHLFPIGACGAIILSWTIRGGSEPTAPSDHQACLSAYKSAQELERIGRFLQAKELVDSCMSPGCGWVLQRKCAFLSSMMASDIPSVVPVVTDEAGKPRIDVKVTMDGAVLTSRLDGRAVPIDPGLHEFSFSMQNRVIVKRQIMIGQGERNRAILISLRTSDMRAKTADLPPTTSLEPKGGPNPTAMKTTEPLKPGSGGDSPLLASSATEPAADSPERRVPSRIPYLIGFVGVAGIGGFALLSQWSSDENRKLAQCDPNCSPESVDRGRNLSTAANVSLGVGIVGLGAAVTSWFLLNSPHSKKGATHSAYSLDVQPTPSGAVASVSGSF